MDPGAFPQPSSQGQGTPPPVPPWRGSALGAQRTFSSCATSSASNSRCSLNRCHARLGQDRRELRLADHQRITPQVVAIQFDQVEAASPTVSSQGSGSMRGRFPPCSIARIAFPSPGQPPFAPDWLSAALLTRFLVLYYTRYQGWHREETRRGDHDRAPHASVADASTANATRMMIMVVLAGPPRGFEHPLRGVVPAPIRHWPHKLQLASQPTTIIAPSVNLLTFAMLLQPYGAPVMSPYRRRRSCRTERE